MPLLPPFRRRLVTVPFDLHNPLWVEDPDFDLDYHVRRTALPSPGGARELAALTAEIAGRPLDRARPLWEIWYVEGLEQDRVAIISKVHHSAIDGMSGVELIANLYDFEAEPEPRVAVELPTDWRPDHVPERPRADRARGRVVGAATAARWPGRCAGSCVPRPGVVQRRARRRRRTRRCR